MKYIYIIKSYGKGCNYVKLGYTSNIKRRLAVYKYHNPDIEILNIFKVENALELEQQFHNSNSSLHYNEWYSEDLYKSMLDFLKENKAELVDLNKEKKKFTNIFTEVVKECKKGDEDYLKWAYTKYDFLELAINHLGFEKIESLNYSPKIIKRYCMKYTHISKEEKVKKVCNDYFQTGLYYDNTTIKNEIQEIYDSLEIEKTAKASDIINYKKVKVKQKMIKGVVTNGYIILN